MEEAYKDQLIAARNKLDEFVLDKQQISQLKLNIQNYLNDPKDGTTLGALRQNLRKILDAEYVYVENPDDLTLAKIAHDMLLILAAWHPENRKNGKVL